MVKPTECPISTGNFQLSKCEFQPQLEDNECAVKQAGTNFGGTLHTMVPYRYYPAEHVWRNFA